MLLASGGISLPCHGRLGFLRRKSLRTWRAPYERRVSLLCAQGGALEKTPPQRSRPSSRGRSSRLVRGGRRRGKEGRGGWRGGKGAGVRTDILGGQGTPLFMAFGGSDSRESARKAGDPGSIPGSERTPGEGNGYPLQYSRLLVMLLPLRRFSRV